jgi:hypothetical protein
MYIVQHFLRHLYRGMAHTRICQNRPPTHQFQHTSNLGVGRYRHPEEFVGPGHGVSAEMVYQRSLRIRRAELFLE